MSIERRRTRSSTRTAGVHLLLVVAVVILGGAGRVFAEIRGAAQPDRPAARTLIEEAQARYGRLPIGPSSFELYLEYADGYGFAAASFFDVCVGLVASSLTRVDSAEALQAEFLRTLTFRDGLLPVYSPLAQKWGLDGSATPSQMDRAITDTEERRLFKTALLADTMATVWSFVLGYQYYKLYGQSPSQPPPDSAPIVQAQVDERLRALAGEAQ